MKKARAAMAHLQPGDFILGLGKVKDVERESAITVLVWWDGKNAYGSACTRYQHDKTFWVNMVRRDV